MAPVPSSSSFRPSCADLYVARAMLRTKLPTELVLHVLDYAEYWPTRTFTMDRECEVCAMTGTSFGKRCFDIAVLPESVLESFHGEKVKVKAVEFHITSHDQGWASEATPGSYNTASWLEASILRREELQARPLPSQTPVVRLSIFGSQPFHNDVQEFEDGGNGWTAIERPASATHYPQDDEDKWAWYLQGNRVADATPLTHEVVWSSFSNRSKGDEGAGSGEGFLEELKAGDRLVVWAKARWAGWSCRVLNLDITVSYGV